MDDGAQFFHGLRLLGRCGGGAYGDVYLCEDISGRRLALKILSKKRLGDAWKRELQGVRNYRGITENSPHLLKIFHVSEDEDDFYYTMEAADPAETDPYVPDTLAYRLQSGALPSKELYLILRGIFDGIRTIHDAGFVHRDIKPDNILFVGGVPKLGDIGLVSSLSNSMTALAGTLEFLPPEVRTSDASDSVDRVSRQRNDLYAFGKVVYCAATGLDASRYPSVPTCAGLTSELKSFVFLSFRLCAKEPLLRIRDAETLKRRMDEIGRQLAAGSRPRLRRAALVHLADVTLDRLRSLAVPLALILALLASGIAVRRWLAGRSGAPQPPPPYGDTAEYSIGSLGLRMRIPRTWQALSEEHVRAQVEEMTRELNESSRSEKEKKLLRHAIMKAGNWKGMISCDLYDKIEISRELVPAGQAENLWTLPEAEVKRLIAAQCLTEPGEEAKIYELRRTTMADRRCVVIDFSPDGHDRVKSYIFLDDKGVITIALTADANTFGYRVREFDRAVGTVELPAPARSAAELPPPGPSSPEPKKPEPKKPEPKKPEPKKPEPKKPEVPRASGTRDLADPRGRFTLSVPENWHVLPEEHAQELLKRISDRAEETELTMLERAQLRQLSLLVEQRGTMIVCGADDGDGSRDIVEITPCGTPRHSEVWPRSDAELRAAFCDDARRAGIADFTVYEVKHAAAAGKDALLLEFSNMPKNFRSICCLVFMGKDSVLQIVLTARIRTFDALRPQFLKLLASLKLSPGEAEAPESAETRPAASVRPAAPARSGSRSAKVPLRPGMREYVNARHKFTIQVPVHWEQVGPRYVESLISEMRQTKKRDKTSEGFRALQIDMLERLVRNGGASFRCDPISSGPTDVVEIVPERFDKHSIWNFTDEYLKSQLQLEARRQSVPFALYDIRRGRIGDRDCLITECADGGGGFRKLVCKVFVDDHNEIVFALAAKPATFPRRKKEFEDALATLRFSR